jgi:hypothetical protein
MITFKYFHSPKFSKSPCEKHERKIVKTRTQMLGPLVQKIVEKNLGEELNEEEDDEVSK